MLDIRKPLLNGDKIIKDNNNQFVWAISHNIVKCHDTDCALCIKFDDGWCRGIHNKQCPLLRVTGKGCSFRSSAYSKFYWNPNLKTATDMVRALVCTYWAERNGEND